MSTIKHSSIWMILRNIRVLIDLRLIFLSFFLNCAENTNLILLIYYNLNYLAFHFDILTSATLRYGCKTELANDHLCMQICYGGFSSSHLVYFPPLYTGVYTMTWLAIIRYGSEVIECLSLTQFILQVANILHICTRPKNRSQSMD